MVGNDGAMGFFGKVASQGDFVTNRFDAGLRRLIDDWLQRSIEYSRRNLGEAWPGAFKTMPIWRFVFAPGLVGQSGFVGLMTPSVDRVGRHFPLLLAARLAAPPSQLHAAENLQRWFDAAERLLVSARQSGFDLDRFDQALAGLPMPPSGDGDIMKGRSFWWTLDGLSSRFSATGLPAPENFERFLGEAQPSRKVVSPPVEEAELSPKVVSLPVEEALSSPEVVSPPPRPVDPRIPPLDYPLPEQPRAAPGAPVLYAASATHSGARLQTDAMALTDGQRGDLHGLARGWGQGVSGAQAATLVIERLLQIAPATTIADLVAHAKGALARADILLRNAREGSDPAGEASVVVLLATGSQWAVVWAGDLRCYLLRDGLMRCLTRDHVEIGFRRALARTVGGSAQFACDIVTDDLLAGDRFLLIAADLVGRVGERKIAARLAEARLADVPTAVIEDALMAGIGGNVAAVAIAAT